MKLQAAEQLRILTKFQISAATSSAFSRKILLFKEFSAFFLPFCFFSIRSFVF
jgi:hypothetical protein